MGKAVYDFSGWVTKNDVKCADGRTIRHGAFADCDGKRVPLVWNHVHNDPENVLGFVDLVCKPNGVYGYGSFNGTERAQAVRSSIIHGDLTGLSIYANQLKERSGDVFHGNIREVSLVLASANPEAFIDNVLAHGDGEPSGFIFAMKEGDSDLCYYEEDDDSLEHSDEDDEDAGLDYEGIYDSMTPEQQNAVMNAVETVLAHSDEGGAEGVTDTDDGDYSEDDDYDEEGEDYEDDEDLDEEDEYDIENDREAFESMTDEQLEAAKYIIDEAIASRNQNDDTEDEEDDSEYEYEEDESDMKHNVFETDERTENYLTHSDEETIIGLAKESTVGSFQAALSMFCEDNDIALQHDGTTPVTAASSGFYQTGNNGTVYDLFPEYKEVRPGAPELITSDQGWISVVMNKVHKSPISRIRTTTVDIRKIDELRAKGYVKGTKKDQTGNFGLVRRTTDPTTVYVKSALHRDDIIDITDFDYVAYLYKIDKMQLNEELATAIMLGDGREDGADGKIDESKIRPIWTDDELYTMHFDLTDEIKSSIQGSNTTGYFGENYVLAESMINLCLYSREKYKGTGTPDMFITPHMLNVMLLARDRNGRRIYSSKQELATAFNVGSIVTAEQFEDRTRTVAATATSTAKTKKLLALIVNLQDYSLGATKGGEVTHFTQFDIDFNQQKSLLETRCSGALTRVYSAIAIEEDVTPAGNSGNGGSNP